MESATTEWSGQAKTKNGLELGTVEPRPSTLRVGTNEEKPAAAFGFLGAASRSECSASVDEAQAWVTESGSGGVNVSTFPVGYTSSLSMRMACLGVRSWSFTCWQIHRPHPNIFFSRNRTLGIVKNIENKFVKKPC